MRNGPLKHRSMGAVAVALLVIGMVLPGGVSSAQAPEPVPWQDAVFGGYATGTVLHADLLETGDSRLENTEVARSDATVESERLLSERFNEMQRLVHPALPDKHSYGRGSGLEVGLGVSPEDDNQVIVAGKAEADAPPDDQASEEIGPLDAGGLAWAALLRGQAHAQWQDDSCPIGDDISRGLGYAEDVQLLDTGEGDEGGHESPLVATSATDPERAGSQSTSRTTLVPQENGDGWGLMSETRQTIQPVTLFKGTENEFTIEFLGEWVLRAVATGQPGGAVVHYGPGEVSPETPIVRVIQDQEVVGELLFQDLLGEEGTTLEVEGLAEIAVGEDPRAIGGDADSEPTEAADGTEASGAVDVVRIKLLEQIDEATGEVSFRAEQLRIGHFEVATAVPAGGIECELPVEKIADPAEVVVGAEDDPEAARFDTPIAIHNTTDCDLVDVRVTDDIRTEGGATFEVLSTDPVADQVPEGGGQTEGQIIWNDVGPIAPGDTTTVTASFEAQSSGLIIDLASVDATLANCAGDATGEGSAIEGVASAVEGAGIVGASDEVRVDVVEVAPRVLPRTGAGTTATVLGGVLLAGLGAAGLAWRRRMN